ncbi:MAG: type pilus assembly PilZ [Bacteriovoracaceae bacterium]|nr:type pilus assembly PilZ [Bacteriovoracaceae bacterium]
MSQSFGNQSSVKVLQLLTQYKKLSARPPKELDEFEAKLLQELETKLAVILETKKSSGPPDLSKRQKLRVDANYQVRMESVGEFKKAYIKNISGGGFFIETDNLSAMGTQITLELFLPEEKESLKIKGEVAWTNPKKGTATPQGIGIKFLSLSEPQRLKIQKLVNMSLENELKTLSKEKKK